MMNKQSLKQVLFEQKEEAQGILKEKIVPREAGACKDDFVRSNLIKVMMGVRRSGKSTLAHDWLKGRSYGYVNFDDERLLGARASDLNDILEILHEISNDCQYLLFDEIQNVDGWELFVNRLKRNGYNVVVTGSNSRLLSKELATHLTGRHLSIELYPFSFAEYLALNQHVISNEKRLYSTREKSALKKWLQQYLQTGGFPEAGKMALGTRYLQELYDKIITRDIIWRYNIKYVRDLKEIALFAISNFSSRASYHKIRNIFEIKSVHTVKNYLHYLEEAYLLFQLNSFSFKLKEQIRMPRKLYCIDTGMIHAVVPKTSFDFGRIIENAVFLELKRRGQQVFFYSGLNYEVDFLIKKGLKIERLIQVSYSIEDKDTWNREYRALLKASKELGCRDLMIITWDEEFEEKVNSLLKIKCVPLWKWLVEKI